MWVNLPPLLLLLAATLGGSVCVTTELPEPSALVDFDGRVEVLPGEERCFRMRCAAGSSTSVVGMGVRVGRCSPQKVPSVEAADARGVLHQLCADPEAAFTLEIPSANVTITVATEAPVTPRFTLHIVCEEPENTSTQTQTATTPLDEAGGTTTQALPAVVPPSPTLTQTAAPFELAAVKADLPVPDPPAPPKHKPAVTSPVSPSASTAVHVTGAAAALGAAVLLALAGGTRPLSGLSAVDDDLSSPASPPASPISPVGPLFSDPQPWFGADLPA